MKDPRRLPRVKFGKKVEVVGLDSDEEDRKKAVLPNIRNWVKRGKSKVDEYKKRSTISRLDEPAIDSAV